MVVVKKSSFNSTTSLSDTEPSRGEKLSGSKESETESVKVSSEESGDSEDSSSCKKARYSIHNSLPQ